MRSWFFRLLYTLVRAWMKQRAESKVSEWKLQGLKLYIRGVQVARGTLIGAFLGFFCLLTMALSIVGLMISLWILLPWTLEAKAWTLLGLSGFILLTASIVSYCLLSEKQWMKAFKVDELVSKALGD